MEQIKKRKIISGLKALLNPVKSQVIKTPNTGVEFEKQDAKTQQTLLSRQIIINKITQQMINNVKNEQSLKSSDDVETTLRRFGSDYYKRRQIPYDLQQENIEHLRAVFGAATAALSIKELADIYENIKDSFSLSTSQIILRSKKIKQIINYSCYEIPFVEKSSSDHNSAYNHFEKELYEKLTLWEMDCLDFFGKHNNSGCKDVATNPESTFTKKYYALTGNDDIVIAFADADVPNNGIDGFLMSIVERNLLRKTGEFSKISGAAQKSLFLVRHCCDSPALILGKDSNDITLLGDNKIENVEIIKSNNGKKCAYKLTLSVPVINRYYIDLQSGKFLRPNEIIYKSDCNPSETDVLLEKSDKKPKHKKLNARSFHLNCTLNSSLKPEHFIFTNKKGEMFLTENTRNEREVAFVKNPTTGEMEIRVDLPQCVFSEEYYDCDGYLLNQRFYDRDGSRLIEDNPSKAQVDSLVK